LKVALVSDWHPLSIGGVQSHVRYLAKFLKEQGLEVHIISRKTHATMETMPDSMSQHKFIFIDALFPLNTIFIPPKKSRLEKVLREIRPDIVHSHHAFTLLSLLSLELASKHRIPRVLTNHSITLGYEYSYLWKPSSIFFTPIKQWLSHANVVISVSKAADKFISNFLKNSIKRLIIPNGVDTEKYKPPKEPPKTPTVLFIGRLVHRKGPHLLLKSFKNVIREVPEAKLIIVGRGYMETILRSMAAVLDLRRNIVFKGFVSEEEKISLLGKSMVVAIPSIYGESFGIVAVEAFATGNPVVAFKVGGLSEIVDHSVNGFLVNTWNIKRFSDYLITLLLDRKLRRKMSERARVKAERNYSWKIISKRIYKVYLALHSEKSLSLC